MLSGGFQHLQVDRREQPRLLRVASVGRRIGQNAVEIADPLAPDPAERLRRIVLLAECAHGGKQRAHVEQTVVANRGHGRTSDLRQKDPSNQRAACAVLR
jgi:hypothetical protein